jgi:y4mF family transcriptional regulator
LQIYTLKGAKQNFYPFLYPKGCIFLKYTYFYTLKGIEMTLSQFVKERRSLAGLTQPELAEKAGVGLRFLRELEQGKETLRLDKVNQVLRLFGYQMGPIPLER